MKRRLVGIVIGTWVLAMGAQAAPAAAQEVLSATCPGPPTSNRAFGPVVGAGDNRWLQTFTAQHTGTLTTVTVNVYNSSGTPGDFLIQIVAVDGRGVPVSGVNGVLATQTIDDATVPTMGPTAGFITAHPSPVLNVTAGQQYALATSRPASDTSGIRTVEMDPCPGDLFSGGPAGDVLGIDNSPNGDEMPFSAFVTLPAPVPPPSTTPATRRRKKCKKKKRKRNAESSRKRCKKKKKR